MPKTQVPAIDGWFTTGDEPALLGHRDPATGDVFFPKLKVSSPNPASRTTEFEEVELSRRGRIWSYTDARYQPPERLREEAEAGDRGEPVEPPEHAAQPEPEHDEDEAEPDGEPVLHRPERGAQRRAERACGGAEERIGQRLPGEVEALVEPGPRGVAEREDEAAAHADAVGTAEEAGGEDEGEVVHGGGGSRASKATAGRARPARAGGGSGRGGGPDARTGR